MGKKIVIVGGVAAGATAAARARRISEDADITIIEKSGYIAFANCGLPYYVSKVINQRSQLFLQTAQGFDARYRIKVMLNTEAIFIDRDNKTLTVSTQGGQGAEVVESKIPYDSLILAQGGSPIVPRLEGIDGPNVFTLWTIADVDALCNYLETTKPVTALIAGGGFIGLEMAEALQTLGLRTTLVELMPAVMPAMDAEFGSMIRLKLEAMGVKVVNGVGLDGVDSKLGKARLSDGSIVDADVVLVSVGVRPELALARQAGLAIGPSGGLAVDDELRSCDPDIFAAGDMAEVTHQVSGKKVRMPLAGPANRQGRIAASNALGMHVRYRGVLGTNVFKLFDAVIASTGVTEKQARECGFDVGAAVVYKDNHASYYPGGQELALKLVYDRASSRLLGAQCFGGEGVEKRIDVIATALQARMSVDDLAELDLSYAPPFSSANDPVNVAAFIALNDISGFSPLVTAHTMATLLDGKEKAEQAPLVVDVRTAREFNAGHIAVARHIPLDELRQRLSELPRDRTLFIHCRSGYRAHLGLRILKENGFDQVFNITGGYMAMLTLGGFALS